MNTCHELSTDLAVLDSLRHLPNAIHAQEHRVWNREKDLALAKDALAQRERALLTLGSRGPINGSNAETRKAQLEDETEGQRADVRTVAENVEMEKMELRRLQNLFSAAKALAGIIAAGYGK